MAWRGPGKSKNAMLSAERRYIFKSGFMYRV
jgi:hypothetical protein